MGRSGRERARSWANSYDEIRGQKKKAVGKNDGKDGNIYASCTAKELNHMLFNNADIIGILHDYGDSVRSRREKKNKNRMLGGRRVASSIKSPQSPTVSDVCLFEIEKSGARLLAVLLSTNKREAGVEDEWKEGGGQKAGVYLLHSPFLFAVDFVVEKKTFVHGLVLGNSVSKTSLQRQQRISTGSVGLRLY